MSSSTHAASSPAGTASTTPATPPRKRVDFLTGYCGLSPPTLFRRIGTMAADGQPLLAPTVQTTPSSIASGPGYTLGNRIRMGSGKPSSGPMGRTFVRSSAWAWPRQRVRGGVDLHRQPEQREAADLHSPDVEHDKGEVEEHPLAQLDVGAPGAEEGRLHPHRLAIGAEQRAEQAPPLIASASRVAFSAWQRSRARDRPATSFASPYSIVRGS
jgi:hypothetical protein